ncbi:hypothetical protein ACO0K9_18695 [Undibacterium sp. Ji50W]|uniref:hypothetical protein n=1 Tax=Undibacterium sp. Ji50W TaxID=3413041 RepID=UPI003BF0BD70
MNKIIAKVFAALAISMAFTCLASEVELPRMWEVTGTAKNGNPLKFYILGVSHNGLDPEYDNYFYKKVIPIFNTADVFSREASFWSPTLVPECPTPLTATPENREMIHAAREKVRVAQKEIMDKVPIAKIPGATDDEQKELDQIQDKFRADTAKVLADSYSEFGLIWAMRQLFQQLSDSDPRSKDIQKKMEDMAIFYSKNITGHVGNVAVRKSIDQYFMHYKPGMKAESIDATQDIVDAYCSAGSGRSRLFQKEFNAWEYQMDDIHLQERLKARIQADIDFEKSMKKGKISGSLLNDIDEHSAYVCTRNPKWLKKMITDNDKRVAFYALGLAHLLPRSDGKHPCDDLLTMLRKTGLSVELIP